MAIGNLYNFFKMIIYVKIIRLKIRNRFYLKVFLE